MAGDWIKMEKATPDKPEVWAIAEAADMDPDAVVGKLFRVWSWFDDHTEDGNAPSVTKKLLDRLVGVTGFCDLMVDSGWMVEKDGTITLPNFKRHNGETAKSRALGQKRAAKHRDASNGKSNGGSVTGALPEKRREEKREKKSKKEKADPLFDQFWSAYPNKKAKGQAKKAWEKIEVDDTLLGQMLEAIEAQKADKAQRQEQDGWAEPWKHPSTWLNGECWLDEVSGVDTPPESEFDRCQRRARELGAETFKGWGVETHEEFIDRIKRLDREAA